MTLKIATYNLNGIRARIPALLAWLKETQPDIVCLQELKSAPETIPTKEVEAAGYGALWHGQKGFNGVAILARGAQPIEVTRTLPPISPLPVDQSDTEDRQARYLEADVMGLRVASLYLPNGNPQPGPKYSYKISWMRRLRAHATELLAEEVPTVLAGDYNVIPHADDVYAPAAMIGDALRQPQSRAEYFRLLGDGWSDALRLCYPTGYVWTYWDYQAGAWPHDRGFRIDHLLLSPAVADRLTHAGTDRSYRGREKASDHAPVWVMLR